MSSLLYFQPMDIASLDDPIASQIPIRTGNILFKRVDFFWCFQPLRSVFHLFASIASYGVSFLSGYVARAS